MVVAGGSQAGGAGRVCSAHNLKMSLAVQSSTVVWPRLELGGVSCDSLPTLGAVNFNPGTHVVRIHPVNTTVTITTAALVSLSR